MRTPKPMPGPIAASPITSPRPMVARPSLSSAACASRANMVNASLFRWSVLFGHRAADVGRGQDGEDERLKPGYEDLEAHEGDADRERERCEDDRESAREHGHGAEEEHGEQEVARHEVGPESD